MPRNNAKDEIDFVRQVMRDALWDIAYHEHALPKAQVELQFAREMMKRGDFDVEAERADLDNEGDEDFRNVTQFALSFYDEQISSVEHHEEKLASAYRAKAFAKAMLLRGNYTEIDVQKIQKEVDEIARKWSEKKDEA